MAMNFSKRREALRMDRETGIRNIEPNPARAVEKTSLVPFPVSSEETGTNPPADVSVESQNQEGQVS